MSRTRRPDHTRRRPFRFLLERLEDRLAPAQVFWAVDTDGFWDLGSNWSTGVVPGPNDDVVIDRTTPVSVTHRSGSDTVRSIIGRDALAVASFSTLTVTGAVDVTGGVTLLGGTLSRGHLSKATTVRSSGGALDQTAVDGTIDLGAVVPGNAVEQLHVTGGMTLSGTVLLTSTDGARNGQFIFDSTETLGGTGSIQSFGNGVIAPFQYSGATVTVGPGITFRGGSPSIGTDGATLVNQGTILTSGPAPNTSPNTLTLKNVVNHGTIRTDSGAGLHTLGTWSNFGTMHVEGGGEMFLAGTFHNAGVFEAVNATTTLAGDFTTADLGVFHRIGGTVNLRATLDNRGTKFALDDSTGSWNLTTGGTILGGSIYSFGSARLFAQPISAAGTLDGVTLNGALDMTPAGSQLYVAHGLTLNGTLHLGGNSSNSVRFTDSSILDGTGSVLLDGQPPGFNTAPSFGPTTGLTLHIRPHVAVSGGGDFGYGLGASGAVVTEAVIDAGINGMDFPGGVTVNGTGALADDPAAIFVLDTNLLGNTTNADSFALRGRTLLQGGNGRPPAQLEVMSADKGPVSAGFSHNFAYGTLDIGTNRMLQLVDQSRNSPGTIPEVLYVDALIVRSGATLDLNGLKLYARVAQIDGSVVGGTVTQVPDSGPITLGTATAGRIGLAGELDEWTYFGRQGRAVTAVVQPGGNIVTRPVPPAPQLQWAEVRLLAADGTVLADVSNTQAGQAVTLAGITLPADGTYRLQVRAPAGHTASTGNYIVSIFDATATDRVLQVNVRANGHIGSPYGVDRWHFAADAGQQVRLHLIAVRGGLAFRLAGPDGSTLFTDQTTDSDVLTLPAGGAYTLSAYARTGGTGDYAFTQLSSTATDLTPGTPVSGSLAGQGYFRLYRLRLTAAGSLAFDLGGATADEHLELYVRQGAPPNRADFQYHSADPRQLHQYVLLPQAAAGDWYALVYGEPATAPAQYQLTATTKSLLVAAVTPNQGGTGVDTVLAVSGLSFTAGTTVALIGAGGTSYAGQVEVFSSAQLTVRFAANTIPPGTYSVRATQPGSGAAQLDNAVRIVAGGTPHLDVHLDAPATLPYHRLVSDLAVEYANTGDAAMPAPVITLHASNHAFMTLDHSVLVGGFSTFQQPDAYSDTVQILAAGAAPGLLLPGETVRVPVYWAGQQLNPNGPREIHFQLTVSTADQTDPIDWNALQASLQPPHMSAEVWSAVLANLRGQIGTTWGDYVRMLDDNEAYLSRLGESVTDVRQLFDFEMRQAFGLTPVPTLADVTDAALPAPGLALSFDRIYANTIPGHYQAGPFGRGWYTPWQDVLQGQPDGTRYIVEAGGAERRFQPSRGALAGGGYYSSPGDHGVLTDDGGGGFLLTELDGTARHFRPDGKLDSVQDRNGNRITAGYNAAGRLASLTHSAGPSLTIAYNAAGLIASVTDSANRATLYTYDAANQHLVAVQAPDGRVSRYTYVTGAGVAREHALTTIQAPSGSIRTLTYDDHGRLASDALTGGADHVDYSYDAAGGVTVTDAAGQGELFFNNRGLLAQVRDPLGNTTRWEFDEFFNPVRVTGADGLPSTFAYDAAGNVVRATDAAGNTTAFTYGPFNRLTSVTDALGHTTHLDYDVKGNLLHTIYPDSSIEKIVPDAVGDAASFTSRNGAVISYTRNAAGQVTRRAFADGTHQDYTYDARGNLLTAADPTGTTTFAYDAGDRLTRVTYPGGRFLAYTYDAAGRRIRMVDQDGFAVKYAYDAVGRLSDLTDDAGARIDHYTYDAAGRLSREDKGNGTYTTYQYDAAGELLHLVNFAPNGLVNSRFDHSYDALGRRMTMVTLDGAWAYTYDAIGQLTHAVFTSTNPVVPSQDLRYDYDADGNRTRTVLNGTATDYTANSLNEYTQVGGANYNYDLDGNLTSVTDAAGTSTYTYDALDRLTGVTSAAGSWAYEYDAMGNRTAATSNGQRTEYLVDPTGLVNVVGQYVGGTAVAHFTRGLGLTSQVGPNGAAYYDFDALGSTAGLSTAAGAYANRYSYLPFGEAQMAAETLANPFHFVGRFGVMREGNGLQFMRARYYTSPQGRFISEDPAAFAGGDANLFRYGFNAPTSLIDPTGLKAYYWVSGPYSGPPSDEFDGEFYDAVYREQVTNNHRRLWGDDLIDPAYPDDRAYDPNDTDPRPSSGKDFIDESLDAVPPTHHFDPFSDLGSDDLGPSHHFDPFSDAEAGDGLWWDEVPDGWDFGPEGPGEPLPVDPPDLPPGPDQPPEPDPLPVPRSMDPNSKTGPVGVGAANFVRGDADLPYRVDFENDAHATAPAQHVDITDKLSPSLDGATLEFTAVGFGSTLVTVPAGSHYFYTELTVAENGQNLQLQIELRFDPNLGLITATFDSLDPVTGLPPDVLTGFLPPEDGTGRGQGYFSYVVKPRPGLPSGTAVRNVALVRFDYQEIIATDQVDDHDPTKGSDPAKEALATLDTGVPTSSVQLLPTVTTTASFPVRWSGTDETGGSGVAAFNVYASDNGGPFTLWQSATTATSAVYSGQNNHAYAFYSVAVDSVGHVQPTPAGAQATTTVNARPPLVQMVAVNGGAAQRSTVMSIAVTFNQVVAVATGAFILSPDAGGPAISLNQTVTVVNGQTVATLTFAGAGIVGGSLSDGRYTLTVVSASVRDTLGTALDGNGDGQAGGDNVSHLFRLFGDVNGDGTVNVLDLTAFRNAFGTVSTDAGYVSFLDFNGDGAINVSDLSQFRNRFGVILP
jgi:RHS repeat-associated protein